MIAHNNGRRLSLGKEKRRKNNIIISSPSVAFRLLSPRCIFLMTTSGFLVVVFIQVALAQVLGEKGQQQQQQQGRGTGGSNDIVYTNPSASFRNLPQQQSTTNNNNNNLQHHQQNRLLETNEKVTCIAWRATDGCSPQGERRSQQAVSFFADTDLSCDQYVPNYGSGYCELQIIDDGDGQQQQQQKTTIRVYQKSCARGKLGPFPFWKNFVPIFRCDQAVAFLNYKHRALQYRPPKPIQVGSISTTTTNEPPLPSRGILMQIYPSAMVSVYAIIKLLREIHDCTLPIELWHVEGEIKDDHPMLQHLLASFDSIHSRTISKQDMGGSTNNSYLSKPYAIAYSQFDQVLFLDSDNFPLKDPTYLFDSQELHGNTAMFWKDFWNPKRNDYVMTKDSVVWELLGIDITTTASSSFGIPPNEEMEMESGQLIIDRRKSVDALQALMFLTQTFSEWLEPLVLVWGDKDLFRLAWYMTQTPFHYVAQPPSLAGKEVVLKNFSYDKVCGITMVQHDPDGDPIFFHRNIAKISTEADLIKVWQKGTKFVGTNPDVEYEIEGSRSYYRLHGCYHEKAHVRSFFEEIDYRGSNVEHFEEKILQFAREGLDIQKTK